MRTHNTSDTEKNTDRITPTLPDPETPTTPPPPPLSFEDLLSESLDLELKRKEKQPGRSSSLRQEDKVQHRLDTWIESAVVMVFNEQTCKSCGEIVTYNASTTPLIRTFNPRNPTELWYHTPISDKLPAKLPRAKMVTLSTVAQCNHCWEVDGEVGEEIADALHDWVTTTPEKLTTAPDTQEPRATRSSDPSTAALENLWEEG